MGEEDTGSGGGDGADIAVERIVFSISRGDLPENDSTASLLLS